jgi:hypothetical protein
MNHQTVASAMCKVTDEVLWQPRKAWALKHNPGADLKFRVGSGKKTYLRHQRDLADDARMTITYGSQMVASKTDPVAMCRWLSSREIHKRRYYDGELNLLNILSHTIAHEFGHFVQVILGRSYSGSVHNAEFYTILDRIHSGGEGDKIREALHSACMHLGIDLRRISANPEGLNQLSGRLPSGEKAMTMREVREGQQLWFLAPAMQCFGPVRVREKRRTRIVVESITESSHRWIGYPAGFSRTPP